tara:strand:- start:139 stop:450 length:312 start_codon:yes stop_codon:yes gene_type:complete
VIRAGVLLAAFLFCFSTVAYGNNLGCDKTNPAEYLIKEHGEEPFSIALFERQFMLTTYVNHDTGSWTMVAKPPDQEIFCLFAKGEAFFVLKETKKKSGNGDVG